MLSVQEEGGGSRWEAAVTRVRSRVAEVLAASAAPPTVIPFELVTDPVTVTNLDALDRHLQSHRPRPRGGRSDVWRMMTTVLERIESSSARLIRIEVLSDGRHTAEATAGDPTAADVAARYCEVFASRSGPIVVDWVWPDLAGDADLAIALERIRRCLDESVTWSVRTGDVPAVVFIPWQEPVVFTIPTHQPPKAFSRDRTMWAWIDPRLAGTDLAFEWDHSELANTRADFGFLPVEFSLAANQGQLCAVPGRFELGNYWDMQIEQPYSFILRGSLSRGPRDLAVQYVGTNPFGGAVELLPLPEVEVLGPDGSSVVPVDVTKNEIAVPIILRWNAGARTGRLSWSTPLATTLETSLWTRPAEGPPARWEPPTSLTEAGEVELLLRLRRPKAALSTEPLAEPEKRPTTTSGHLFESSESVHFALTGLETDLEASLRLVVDPPPLIEIAFDADQVTDGAVSRVLFGREVVLENALTLTPRNNRAKALPLIVALERPEEVTRFEVLDLESRNVLRRGVRLAEELDVPTSLTLKFETAPLPQDGVVVTLHWRQEREGKTVWQTSTPLRLVPTGPRVLVPQPVKARTELTYRTLGEILRTPIELRWNQSAIGGTVTVERQLSNGLLASLRRGDELIGESFELDDSGQMNLVLELKPDQYGEHRADLSLTGLGHRRDLQFVITRPVARFRLDTPSPLPTPQEAPRLRVDEAQRYTRLRLQLLNADAISGQLLLLPNVRPGVHVSFVVGGEPLVGSELTFDRDRPRIDLDVFVEVTFDYWKRFGFPNTEAEPASPPLANVILVRPESAADSIGGQPEASVPIHFRLRRPGLGLQLGGEAITHLDLGDFELPGTGYWGWLVGGDGGRTARSEPLRMVGKELTRKLLGRIGSTLLDVSVEPTDRFPASRLVAAESAAEGSHVAVEIDLASDIEPNLLSRRALGGELRFRGPEGIDTPSAPVPFTLTLLPVLGPIQILLLIVVFGGVAVFLVRWLFRRQSETREDRLWSHLQPPGTETGEPPVPQTPDRMPTDV